MPYVPNLEEEQKNQDQQGLQVSGGAPTAGGGGNLQTGSISGAVAPSGNKELHTGSGFQNLDKYLSANQSQDFGGQLVSKVQGDVNQAKSNIGKGAEDFTNKVKTSNTIPTDEQVNEAISHPEKANAKDFQNWESQTYKGPTQVTGEDYNQLYQGVNDANLKAKYLGTEPGRFTLLDSYYGKPTYNQGQKSLDNLLVQNQQGIGNQINHTQSQANQLNQSAKSTQQNLINQASAQAKAVAQSAANTRNAIGVDSTGNVITGDQAGAIGKQYTDVEKQIVDQNAARAKSVTDLSQGLAQGQLSNQQIKDLGLDNINYYNLNPADYLKANSVQLSKNNVLSDQQRAYIQALSQLAGTTDTFAAGQHEDSPSAYNFDKDRFLQDTSAAGKKYQDAINQVYENVNAKPSPFIGPRTLDPGSDTLENMQNYYNNNKDHWLNTSYEGPLLQNMAKAIAGINDVNSKYMPNKKFKAS